MNQNASEFLKTLLFASVQDDSPKWLKEATVHQFAPSFVEKVESFIAGFEEYLDSQGFDMDRLDNLQNSFGGNVYFSLIGHGCGFFDEYGDEEKTLGDELQALIDAYSGNHYRFEGLGGTLSKTGKYINLAFKKEYVAEYLDKYFTVTK